MRSALSQGLPNQATGLAKEAVDRSMSGRSVLLKKEAQRERQEEARQKKEAEQLQRLNVADTPTSSERSLPPSSERQREADRGRDRQRGREKLLGAKSDVQMKSPVQNTLQYYKSADVQISDDVRQQREYTYSDFK